jgi:hypothetical protein
MMAEVQAKQEDEPSWRLAEHGLHKLHPAPVRRHQPFQDAAKENTKSCTSPTNAGSRRGVLHLLLTLLHL